MDTTCPACLDDVAFPPIVLGPCGHVVCGECVIQIHQSLGHGRYKCPLCNGIVTGHIRCHPMRTMAYDMVSDEKRAKEEAIMAKLSVLSYAIPEQPVHVRPLSWSETKYCTGFTLCCLVLFLAMCFCETPNIVWTLRNREKYAELYTQRVNERSEAQTGYRNMCIYDRFIDKDSYSLEALKLCEIASNVRVMNPQYAAFGDFMHFLAGLKPKRRLNTTEP